MKLAPAYLTLVLINAIDVESIIAPMRFSQVRKLAGKWLAQLVTLVAGARILLPDTQPIIADANLTE
jgi:hypothetical protein